MSRRARIVPLTAEARRRVRRDPRLMSAASRRYADSTWRSQGRCLEQDPELFFPATQDSPDGALSVCRGCGVQGACLAAALDAGDFDGVWGGTTPEERRSMCQVWPLEARADVG